MTPVMELKPDPRRDALVNWFADLNDGMRSISSGRFAAGEPERNADSVLALLAALSSPETTPAGVLALDTERLRKAIDLSGIGIAEGGHAASEWADAVAREYNRIGGAPKEDWQCQTVGCYLHAGHASEHEPGMCECGADMEAHYHDQFMEGLRGAPAGVLDEAWAAAQAARPSDSWSVSVRRRSSGSWEAWAQDLASSEKPPVIRIGEGTTEAAALHALAAALGR